MKDKDYFYAIVVDEDSIASMKHSKGINVKAVFSDAEDARRVIEMQDRNLKLRIAKVSITEL